MTTTDPDALDRAREDDGLFFEQHPGRRMRLRRAWPYEVRDCRNPADSSQCWFVIAEHYTDGTVGHFAPFLESRDLATDVSDLEIHELMMRVIEGWRRA
jgi:hypothetical protein